MTLMARSNVAALAGAGTLAFACALPAFAESPGTDAFGNFITSSDFDPNIPTGLFFDISGTGLALVGGNDEAAQDVSLGGLVFPFYGTNYTNLTFSTNGYISTYPIDSGIDFSNDFPLPSPPSSGGGARIYAYHDDLVGTVYGQYFDPASSPFGTETYVAQWDANLFGDSAEVVRFNVMLLRDGTIIMAYDEVSSTAGGTATVGIQNDGATDGVAYLGNESVMSDGMTIVVFGPTPFGGLAQDMSAAGAELALMQARAQADLTTDRVRAAFAADSDEAVTTASTGIGDQRLDSGLSVWAGATGTGARGNAGPGLTAASYGIHAGADYLFAPGMIGGVAVGYTGGSLDVGMFSSEMTAFSVEPYVGFQFADRFMIKGSVGYARSHYSRVTMPLGSFTTNGNRFFGSLTGEARFDLPTVGLSIVPQIALTGGTERFANLTGSGVSIPVPAVNFFTAEASARLEKTFVSSSGVSRVYALGGIDHVSTNAGGDIALFATNYRNNRFGGVAGAGFSFTGTNGLTAAANVTGRGLGSSVASIEGRFKVGVRF